MEWLLEIPLWFRLSATFVLGTIVGSFLNVCILRLPWDKSIFWPGSHCPECEKPIAWYDNVPILSWVVLGGKCRNCRTGISPRYAAVELLTGVLFALLYWVEVDQQAQYVAGGPADTAYNLHVRYLYHLFLVSGLIVATFIDLDYQIIPDSVTVPGMVVGLSIAFLVGQVHLIPAWIVPNPPPANSFDIPAFFADHPHWHGLIASALGFVVGGGVVWMVRIIGGTVLQKEAMGFGDVTLMAMIGSFVGWQAALMIFFLAPFVGMVVAIVQWLSRGDNLIPYGPYLSLGTLGVLVAWKPIWSWIIPFFSLGWLVPITVFVCVLMLGVLLIAWRLIWWMAGVLVGSKASDDPEDSDDAGGDPEGPTPEGTPPGELAGGEPEPPREEPVAIPGQDDRVDSFEPNVDQASKTFDGEGSTALAETTLQDPRSSPEGVRPTNSRISRSGRVLSADRPGPHVSPWSRPAVSARSRGTGALPRRRVARFGRRCRPRASGRCRCCWCCPAILIENFLCV